MDYSFVIRRAVAEDAAAIKKILNEAFTKYIEDTGITSNMDALLEDEDYILKDIHSKDVFIALIDNIPVGTIRVQIKEGGSAYISRFGVCSDYHNIGIGKALMNLIDKILISRNISRVYLHTASKYRDLVRFYYGRGFYTESISNERGYIRALMVKEYSS